MAKQGAEAGPKLSGVLVVAEGFYAPKAMDLTESFSGIYGSVAGFLGNRRILLGVRVGGRKLWGAYPFFESATIGGSHTVHGYDTNRFRGDSSVFGNVELRLGLGRRKKPVLPVQWSLIGYYDVGRVWLAGETSDLWHQGYGGGILAEVMGVPGLAIRGSMASSREGGLHFYATTGYSF
jgi:outer membrane protein assembly factor BamA